MKPERHIQGKFEKDFSGVIDETAAIAVRHRGESFTEVFGVRELQTDYELACFVDVAPLAGIRDQAEVRDSCLSNVDGRQAFGKTVDDVELRRDYNLTRRI